MFPDHQTIHPQELLARFILHSRYFRTDNTVKSDAFVPHPYADLSVTRHIELSDERLWDIGRSIAVQSNKNLYGRADVMAANIFNLSLSINPAPRKDNPNHANISGWPPEKSAQKSIAQLIVSAASSTRCTYPLKK